MHLGKAWIHLFFPPDMDKYLAFVKQTVKEKENTPNLNFLLLAPQKFRLVLLKPSLAMGK